jgi:hypothetical protein
VSAVCDLMQEPDAVLQDELSSRPPLMPAGMTDAGDLAPLSREQPRQAREQPSLARELPPQANRLPAEPSESSTHPEGHSIGSTTRTP